MWSKSISCEGVYINCETVKYIDAKQVCRWKLGDTK